MRDTELYRHLLGLVEPWTVDGVDLDIEKQRVDVWVDHPKRQRWPCPECSVELPVYDHAQERTWRHLDSCQFLTYLHARPPRVSCPDHGVLQVRLPWADPKARFTLLFERFAIDVLRRTTLQAATSILRISWDEAWHIMDRAVTRGLARKPPRPISRIGVDEKAYARGHRYLTIVSDIDGGTVEHIEKERTKKSFEAFFDTRTPEQLEAIEAVAMDMSDIYFQAACRKLPGAKEKIVFDPFHIMKHVNKAVDTVRRREHRALLEKGSSPLTRSKYVWLYGKENVPPKHWDLFYRLRASNLKTARAWAIKESFRTLWAYVRPVWAERFWKRWYSWAVRSRLDPIVEVAKMLKRHLPNILTFFRHRITNAGAEGINSRIETLRKAACGFRNVDHLITVIYFHLGGLDLYPATH